MFAEKSEKRKKAILRIRSRFGKKASYEVLILKTNRYIYAQLNNILTGKTIFASSSLEIGDKNKKVSARSIKVSKLVGKDLANKCIKNKIESQPVFNRGSYNFHGVVKALIDEFNVNFVINKE
jgi:ribosomal protein L18